MEALEGYAQCRRPHDCGYWIDLGTIVQSFSDSCWHIVEFVRGLRDSGDDNYDRLSKVLAGTAKDTTTIPITPGALLLFGGRNLLHRVTGVEGSRTRYITTLCYRDRPGVTNSPAVRELFYGRREPLTPVAAH